jgi:phosphoribosyl-AMP cyclohydrolase
LEGRKIDHFSLEIGGKPPDGARVERSCFQNPLLPVIAGSRQRRGFDAGFMNEEAFGRRSPRASVISAAVETDQRRKESGNVQEVKEMFYDCDADTLLVKVNQIGGVACHRVTRAVFSASSRPTEVLRGGRHADLRSGKVYRSN